VAMRIDECSCSSKMNMSTIRIALATEMRFFPMTFEQLMEQEVPAQILEME
jgi:hypothetical protein